jgi:hypothetical protein
MTYQTPLRCIDANELALVAGGTDEIVVVGTRRQNAVDTYDFIQFRNAFDASLYGSSFAAGQGGGSGGSGGPAGAPGEFVDTDGDGEEDTIVVTATDWQMDVVDAWHNWVDLHFTLGELGLAFVPMTRVVAAGVDAFILANRDALVDEVASVYYDLDSRDGLVDGYVQPGLLPPNDPHRAPQMQPGYWLAQRR